MLSTQDSPRLLHLFFLIRLHSGMLASPFIVQKSQAPNSSAIRWPKLGVHTANIPASPTTCFSLLCEKN